MDQEQDWFAANAPSKAETDWFAANAAERPEPDQDSAVSRFAAPVLDAINPLKMVQGLASAIAHPVDTARGLLQAQDDQLLKAKERFGQGRYSEALGHGAAGLLPVLGPMAANAGERIGSGDVAGGLGEGVVAAASGPVTGMAGAKTVQGIKATGRALRRGAVRPMMAAMKIDRGALEKLPGVRRKGIANAEREFAQFALDEDVSPVQLRKGIFLRSRGLDDGIEEKLQRTSTARLRRAERAPDEPIAGGAANVEDKLQGVEKWARGGDASQGREASVNALTKAVRTDRGMSDVVTSGVGYSAPRNPVTGKPQLRATHSADRDVRQLRDLRPMEEFEAIRANNELLTNAFKDGLTSPDVKVRRAVQLARTQNLDKAAGTAKLSRRMRDLINLKAIGNVSTRRADASNPFSLVDAVSVSTGRWPILASSMAMKSPVLAELALKMNRTGKAVGRMDESLLARLLQGGLLTSRQALNEQD